MVVTRTWVFVGGAIFALAPLVALGALSCSVTTAASCQSPSVVVVRMSGSINAQTELPSGSTAAYANNVMCCSGVSGLGTSCSGTFATVAKLSATTNAHAQQNSQSGYANNICLSVPPGGSVSIGYQASTCTGFDTTLGSMPVATNSHLGDSTAYTTKICGTASEAAPSLSFTISDSSVGFGPLTSSAARYATGDTNGSGSEVAAHTLAANTTASAGYTISVQGATLTSGSHTITAIGSTNTASVPSVEQFGLRATASGGVGTVSSPYAAAGFAYAGTASTPSTVASAGSGDGIDTTYSVRYLANIAPQTEAGIYTASLVYVITANF